MCEIRFVKSHHIDEDDVALVHEEIAEEIEGFGFTDAGLVVLALINQSTACTTYFFAVFTHSRTVAPLDGMIGL